MFCQKCGNKLEDGVVFCSVCGCKIGVDTKLEPLQNEKLMTKEEFIFSKPHLKAKYDKIRYAKIYNEVFTMIVWFVAAFIVYSNFDKSSASNFVRWIGNNPKELFVPLIIVALITIISPIIISVTYANAPNEELENAYKEYVAKYRQQAKNNLTTINDEDTWLCSKCGIYNQQYVGTCSCGTRKP